LEILQKNDEIGRCMMNKVYVLYHSYEYGEEQEHESTKILGMYSTAENAEKAKNRYSKLDGFSRYPDNCFFILQCEIDKDSVWAEGFLTWDEINKYQEENGLFKDN
jgi:hypothetical protein